MFYYRPTVAEGFDSVRFIVTRVEFGWLIRSIHSWSANLMIFAAFVHMFSVVFTHAYRPPREVTWASGIALLGLLLGFGFSGYLLPWNQISYFATKVGTDVASITPVIGPTIARVLRGGDDVGAPTLTRFFALHVMVLPMLTAGLLVLHVVLVQKNGMSTPPWIPPSRVRQMKFFPNFFLREVMVWYGALAVLGGLAAHFSMGAGRQSGPVRFRANRNSPGVVFPGSVLHAEADPESHLGVRRRASGDRRLRRARSRVGAHSGLGRESRRRSPNTPGHWRGHFPGSLSGHLHRFGVRQMKALLLLLAPALLFAEPPKDTCVECHAAMDGPIQRPALLIKDDVHIANGLSCADCHGGDRTSDDPSVAMSKAKGFLGKPGRAEIPQFCAKCHSNPDFMRRFRPQQRVDQLELYKTSVHGKRLASGDENVATCVDCHSVHDIRAVKDASSPVYPLHIPDTCGRCHADAKKMAKYGIPTDQLAQYRTSVHWDALKGGDLSAPTAHRVTGITAPSRRRWNRWPRCAEAATSCSSSVTTRAPTSRSFPRRAAAADASCATAITGFISPPPPCWWVLMRYAHSATNRRRRARTPLRRWPDG